jgi:hypothetical protein
VHYDQLNGGTGVGLPTELSQGYPNTQFRFTPRAVAGADVEYLGGTHPSQYPNSTWNSANDFADFKPRNASGFRTFNREVGLKEYENGNHENYFEALRKAISYGPAAYLESLYYLAIGELKLLNRE